MWDMKSWEAFRYAVNPCVARACVQSHWEWLRHTFASIILRGSVSWARILGGVCTEVQRNPANKLDFNHFPHFFPSRFRISISFSPEPQISHISGVLCLLAPKIYLVEMNDFALWFKLKKYLLHGFYFESSCVYLGLDKKVFRCPLGKNRYPPPQN